MPMLIERTATLSENGKELASFTSKISERDAIDEIKLKVDSKLSEDDILDDFIDGREFKVNCSASFNFEIIITLHQEMFYEQRQQRLAEAKSKSNDGAPEPDPKQPDPVPKLEVLGRLVELQAAVNPTPEDIALGSGEHISLSSEICPRCGKETVGYNQELHVYICTTCFRRFRVASA